METRDKILTKANEMFFRLGTKSVSMDDIAREVGVSKKTLYQHVENKDDLVHQIALLHFNQERAMIDAVRTTAKDALDEMLTISRYILQMLRAMTPTLLYDLKKYHRKAWEMFECHHQEEVYTHIRENLEMGIEQKIYRDDLDSDIIARLYVGISEFITDEGLFKLSEYNREKLYKEMINYHIRGIASPRGLELYKEYIKLNEVAS